MTCKRLSKLQTRAEWVFHGNPKFFAKHPKKVRISLVVAALQACGLLGDLQTGTKIHDDASREAGDDSTNKYVANTLVSMYAKSGSLEEARAVFGRMIFRTAASWTSLILGYVDRGDGELGLKLFECLLAQGDAAPCLDARVFVAALKACACLAEKEHSRLVDGRLVKLQSLGKGMDVHSRAAKLGFVSDKFVANTLVDMYSKCGSLENARAVFQEMACPDVVSWTALVLGHADNGEEEVALKIFSRMQASGVTADALSFAAALKACLGLTRKHSAGSSKFLFDKVVEIHWQAERCGLDLHVHVASSLIDLYAKLGSVVDARRLFERTKTRRDPTIWTAMVLSYAESREPELAMKLFERMLAAEDVTWAPNQLTYVAALKACADLASMEVVETKQQQQLEGKPVKTTTLQRGMLIHAHAAKTGFDSDPFVGNTLVDMYFKCGSLADASMVFFHKMPVRTVVSWNAVILGYAENDEEALALDLFRVMEADGCQKPDALTYAAALKACSNLAEKEAAVKGVDGQVLKPVALSRGVEVHSRAVAAGCDTEKFVASSLVNMYSKCGSLMEAWKVFERISYNGEVDVISLTSLMLACAENNRPELALQLLVRIQAPDPRAFAAALKACAILAPVETVREIHACISRSGFEGDLFLVNCLVEVYGRCGSITNAHLVFDSLPDTSLVTWHSLMAGYSRLGDTNQELHLFDKLQEEGLRPNGVTFVYLISACSHAGKVDEGSRLFQLMVSKYGITPRMEHYVCMVDLFGRANQLEAAVDVARTMPFKADSLTWLTILGACQKWKNVRIGKEAFENLLKLNEEQDSVYALMTNIYGSVGLWEEQSKVEAMRKKRLQNKSTSLVSGG
ncbi:putative pentatricopeptide repeat-containing protein At3g01580 [Selaginella moellendorffii]|uniref:putative pentatricopeptide repeat-containing protein At3g01580 n=1 Tax=Selaginella moellendorffii TaxID=88036 RepID=UPI000D1C6D03|nr:putative pentatricopeptide repeat-containing protein At3g01580 [Selaginella moellendorffii]|eukprot:XP_024523468.1 putative pentatricopeptide repeat-containing protein At3g01580 [Selaginella moellendorffii]